MRAIVVSVALGAALVAAYLLVVRGGVAPPRATSARTAPAVPAPTSGPEARGRAEPGTGASRPIAPPRQTTTIGFGDGPLALGRRRDPETAAVGPSAISVGRSGEVLINDPVHGRLLRLDGKGKPIGTIKLPSQTVDDLLALPDGSVAALDRLGEKTVWRVNSDGKTLGEFAVEGSGLREAASATGVFADPDGGLFVEVGHKSLVRIDGPSGERQTLPGRPRRDGGIYLRGAIADRKAGIVRLEALLRDGVSAWAVNLPYGAPVLRIVLLDSDRAGNAYVGATVGLEAASPPYAIVEEKLVIIAVDPAGTPRGTLTLPGRGATEETFRELSVGDDGTLYRMVTSDEGVRVETYRID